MQTLDDVLTVVIVLTGLIFVPWVFLIRPWVRRRQAAKERAPEVVNLAARRTPSGWSIRGELARLFLVYDDMSSDRQQDAAGAAADAGVSQLVSAASAPTALPSSASSDPLTADESAARAIAILLNAGLLTNRQKAIEQVFHCSVTAKSRPDTPYQKALKLVEQYQAPAKPEYVGDMIERVKREVAAEH